MWLADASWSPIGRRMTCDFERGEACAMPLDIYLNIYDMCISLYTYMNLRISLN